MPNPHNLTILTELREAAGLTLTQMARRCGLTGKQSRLTAGAWERGEYAPDERRRRTRFIGYLWDDLGLRRDPARFESVWEVLAAEWGWAPIADDEWQRFTTQARPQKRTSVYEAANAQCAPFQAPGVPAHFVGRAAELEQIATLLKPRDDSAPSAPVLAALVGMGGIGKSTLAARVAHLLREHFADGVLWGVAATGSPLDILQSWAKAYGYDFSGLSDVETRAASLRSVLAQKQALIVLDDVTSVEQVRPLLPGCPSCPVLMTTRSEEAALGLGAQVVFVNELAPADGVALLTQILGNERVVREAEAARGICNLLHHLPLAVEIAGQFLASRPRRRLTQWVEQLAAEQSRLDLRVSDRDVRSSFALSWRGLDETQRTVFAHMAVFGGRSFPLEALAATVEPMLNIGFAGVQDVVEGLAALSLARDVEEDVADWASAESVRYQQHPLLADFAREKLAELCQKMPCDEAAPFVQMATHFLSFAQKHQPQPTYLEPEWDNIMAGMGAAHEAAEWQMVLDYADALTEPWFAQAEYVRALQGYAWACEAAGALGNQLVLASLHIRQGWIHAERGEYDAAKQRLSEGLSIAKAIENNQQQAEAKLHLARIFVESGEYEQTDELLSECYGYFAQHDDLRNMAASLRLRGIVEYRVGQYEQAFTYAQQALQIQQQHNFMPDMIDTLRLLADLALAQRNYPEVHQYCKRAMELLERDEYPAELGETYLSLAQYYRRLKDWDEANSYAEKSQRLFERIGKRAFLSYALFEQCIAQAEAGELTVGIATGQKSLTIMAALDDGYNRVVALKVIGDFYNRAGQRTHARTTWQEGHELAQALHHPLVEQFQERLHQHVDAS